MDENLEVLLMSVIRSREADIENADKDPENNEKDSDLHDGLIGLWETGEGEPSIAILLDSETLQPFKKTRYGYSPTVLTIPLTGWSLRQKIDDYCFVTRRGGVFLQF